MAKDYGISKWRGKQVFTLATRANIKAMRKAAYIVERDVKLHFSSPGTGQSYKRGKSGVHIASAPGEPPAIDTGALKASIENEVIQSGFTVQGKVGVNDDKLQAKSGSRLPYGLYLELGTIKMAPRPYLRPALRRCKRKILRVFRNAVK